MSRHRNVRNLVEDDYYDGYDDDDYYDDDYNEEDNYDSYAPPPKSRIAPTKAAKLVTTGTKATKVSATPPSSLLSTNLGVTKPPPGWDKPNSVSVSSVPNVGWGKSEPNAQRPKSRSPKRGGGNNISSTTPYISRSVPDFVRKQKSQLTMVILGHVDAGKSTLMGQVLVSTGQVTKREATKQTNLSWLLDENESERARGVTMEIGTKTLRVPKHDIVVLDAPGHHDFIPVMITVSVP